MWKNNFFGILGKKISNPSPSKELISISYERLDDPQMLYFLGYLQDQSVMGWIV